ncbi:MAG: riboflavin kinase, partial [Bdellovibrionales bacterium]|nr:riboflavin kinase [Bdellovibrionales bacterium]
RIVSGDQRGRKIGYPTANLSPTLQMLPRYGVYAVELNVEGQSFEAIAHVGVRPTFSGSSPTIETHILSDSEFSLYGKKAHISFLAFIREERSFESVSLLQEQIARDIKQVTAFFGSR